MENQKIIIFDFDGTIANTIDLILDIYNNNIAPKHGYQTLKPEDIERLRSSGFRDFIKKYQISTFSWFFLLFRMRRELSRHIDKMRPIKEIDIALCEIKRAGFQLGILTSNSRKNVIKFLKHNNLSDFFDFISSSKNLFGKDKALLKLIKNKNISKDQVVYIGDETRDIEAMKKIDIPIISVSWGFNSKEALKKAQPDQIAEKPEQILECLEKIF